MPHSHQHNHRKAMRMAQHFNRKYDFDSYINHVVTKDTKGEGYEGLETFLYANDILEQEKKTMPMFKISVRLYCWVEHIKTGSQSENKFQASVVTLKNGEC